MEPAVTFLRVYSQRTQTSTSLGLPYLAILPLKPASKMGATKVILNFLVVMVKKKRKKKEVGGKQVKIEIYLI